MDEFVGNGTEVFVGVDFDPLKEKRKKRFLGSEAARKSRKNAKEIKEAILSRLEKEEKHLMDKKNYVKTNKKVHKNDDI